jgi:HK97 family phage major capsid protein
VSVSETIEKQMRDQGLQRAGSGFLVPSEVQNTRDLSATGGGTSGGYLISTDHMPQSFIDLLRSKAIMLSKAGVSVMSGLVGNPSVPRQDGAATGYWVAEGVAPNEVSWSSVSFRCAENVRCSDRVHASAFDPVCTVD